MALTVTAEARARGFGELKLETGTAQPEAMRFYEREGYGRIENFGPYEGEPLSVCYAKSGPFERPIRTAIAKTRNF